MGIGEGALFTALLGVVWCDVIEQSGMASRCGVRDVLMVVMAGDVIVVGRVTVTVTVRWWA